MAARIRRQTGRPVGFPIPVAAGKHCDCLIFVTASVGGRTAVADLCTAYVKRARVSNCQPVIKLSTTEMPTRNFGKVARPQFEIMRWDEPMNFNVEARPIKPTLRNDMADEIPF